MSTVQMIQASTVAQHDPLQSVIIDVRTPMEFANIRLDLPHIFMPLENLDPAKLLLQNGLDLTTPVYLVCNSGGRAIKAAPILTAYGFAYVSVIEHGLAGCLAAGMPLTGPGAKSMQPQGNVISLERQIRITAGSLVALGAILGLFVNSVFVYLSLFIGCGLIFAGVTNQCGMALLLTKAPWNKNAGCAGGSCGTGTPSALTQGKSCS